MVGRLEATPLILDESATIIASKPTNKQFVARFNTSMPEVDLSLVPINPNEIRIRRFVARRKSISVDEMLQKTEAAEKRHQEMLKDIASQLMKNGHEVFQSESIDMAIKCDAGLLVYELKSIDCANAVSQIAKGFFQLLYYSDALTECGVSVVGKGLIVESNLTEDMSNTFSRILGNSGIDLYFYNPQCQWPERVSPRLESGVPKVTNLLHPHNHIGCSGGAATHDDSAGGSQ